MPPDDLNAMLAEHDLQLVASHVGGNLEDTSQATGERQMMDVVLDYLKAMGTGLLMYSGLTYENPAQFDRDLNQLRRAADLCRQNGVWLLYHNHDWEFADQGHIMNALLEECGPELGFCPDIGWIVKGGANPNEMLDRMSERVGAIHLKDVATANPGLDTVILGEGVVPLDAAVAWAVDNRPGLWLIAEQDEADIPAEQAVERNAQYMRRILPEEMERET
jgi:sugar phosphate isomerase/epimerase